MMQNLACLQINVAQKEPQSQVSQQELFHSARIQTEKALATAGKIEEQERDETCWYTEALAALNQAEFAWAMDDLTEAKKRSEDAEGIARAIDWDEGVEKAQVAHRKYAQEEKDKLAMNKTSK